MSGSRLGRGRAGRLALFVCGLLGVIFFVFLYRSTSTEMARLKDLHVKCAQQQEALAAQLQVIYEYKVQLEKTLSNEKSANAAAKEELQQKATRERSLRDKDTVEASQRYNALQQSYNILKAELQDLKDEGKKKEEVARENIKQLEKTLQELRAKQKKDLEAFEHLKDEHVQALSEKEQIENKYENLKKVTSEDNGNVERLQKQVIQLQRELDEAKKTPHFSVGGVRGAKLERSQVLPRLPNDAASLSDNDVNNNENSYNNNADNNHIEKPSNAESNNKDNLAQMLRPSSQQQAVASVASKPGIENSSKPLALLNRSPVKLPVGVPPIPRLIEPDAKKESAGQAPPPPEPEPETHVKHIGEQIIDRHEAESNWFKLKHGVQEVGDPHHIEKSGFENAGGNEDVEQYDDYNYKEPQNKNGDLHLEEGEDEREDEDDYMHNNMNAVKHE
ncbi:probable E3 ubiquitin-protein ligase bre1 [Phymastichus coffea]|uniref:probable E3 ubiquitin-protein ligase bre1 n=1 Tax=Phymastichus coffea TaxID=108790 RepID=UPI00273BC8ED|nr:probable E3 ubiquitin-protein ligase bre1 [Phymastichus coffea]